MQNAMPQAKVFKHIHFNYDGNLFTNTLLTLLCFQLIVAIYIQGGPKVGLPLKVGLGQKI